MITRPDTPAPQGLNTVAANLLATLGQETEALARLHACFDAHMAALQSRDAERLEALTIELNETVHGLETLRQARERQARLLQRLLRMEGDAPNLEALADALANHPGTADTVAALREARRQLREQAHRTSKRCEEYEFALQYAVRLGRETLQVLQDLDVPPPARIYTATGQTSQTQPPRSVVNRVG
ncbi:MAG: hypothetical protein KatS3mg044_0619 [Rhodothermaceae bacterium]|nr:MAG: hypothetical protein KatS3mg044_0619 [Rhodothermaceae bacterium]